MADEIVAADYVNHDPAPGETPGLGGLKEFVTSVRCGFPDAVFTVDDQVAEGHNVATRSAARGTHRAEFAGIPATGKHMTFSALNVHRVVDGKIKEGWFK